MPVIYVTAINVKDVKAPFMEPSIACSVLLVERKALFGLLCQGMNLNYGPHGPYNTAVYKYPKRNDRYLIFRMLLRTEMHPFHWSLAANGQ